MDIDKRKRNKLIRVIFVDILMSLAVIALVFVLVAVVEGWRLGSNLKLEQNGMVQIESLPTGAKVFIDGKQELSETNISKLLSAGEHEITLRKDGYDSWTKRINITSGVLTRLKNLRLFKTERNTEKIEDYGNSLKFVYAAPDHRGLLISVDNTTKWRFVTALGSDKVMIEEVDVKNIFSNTQDGVFRGEILNISWNETGEKILMRVKTNEKNEWAIINLKKVNESVNLTDAILNYADRGKRKEKNDDSKKQEDGEQENPVKEFSSSEKREINQIVILDAVANRFLALIDGNLREIDINAKSLSEVFLKNLDDFKISGSELIYLTKIEKEKRQIGLYRLGEKGGIELETIVRSNKDAKIYLAISEYDSKKYFGFTLNDQLSVYRTDEYPTYENASNAHFEKINEEKLGFVPESFEKSASGELFIAKNQNQLTIYNIDLEEVNRFERRNRTLRWLDNYTMFDVVDGKMEVYDFDGQNRRTILFNSIADGFDAVINSNNRYLYYVVKTDTGFSLKRDRLV